tara:strand:+ start:3365 stop:4258 length:894 start_codon:yes stop_codon:yes gene_type:complete
MQLLYSIINSKDFDAKQEHKKYLRSIQSTYNLYYTLISVFKLTYNLAYNKFNIKPKLKSKSSSSSDKLIINNPYFKFFFEDKIVEEYLNERKVNNCLLDFEYLEGFYNCLITSKFFSNFSKDKNKFDLDLCAYYYKECVANSEIFYNSLEDNEITWVDDFPYLNTYILKQLKTLKLYNSSNFFPKLKNSSSEIIFGTNLLEKVFKYSDYLDLEISANTPNWDKDRIANLDFIILKMAIVELLYFNEIPVKVTLNEYIEIAKDYSTPKSNVFVNGVLDNLSKLYKEKGSLNKTGRGLV